MNNGLPSLLDAIFGKQDLSSVSLDEMYDVIREFPSFNAAHFLLARKLKQQQDAAYAKEAMRTALYFNNPFWLQSLLDEGTPVGQPPSELTEPAVSDTNIQSNIVFEKYHTETPVEFKEEENYIFESYTPVQIPSDAKDELDEETEEILEEKTESESSHSEDVFQYAEPGPETVSSFDELISKYNLVPITPVEESPVENNLQPDQFVPDSETGEHHDAGIFSEAETETDFNAEQTTTATAYTDESAVENFVSHSGNSNDQAAPAPIGDVAESSEEIVNEYGVFEEIVVKKANQDHDLDAFDRPYESDSSEPQNNAEESHSHKAPEFENAITVDAGFNPISENAVAGESEAEAENNSIVENSVTVESLPESEYGSMTGNETAEDSPDKTDEHDYDSFDRPEEEEPVLSFETALRDELQSSAVGTDADDTDAPVIHLADGIDIGQSEQMKNLSERFEEQQKSSSSFQAKNADSIVFTPYHMVDYFASQGIKLVLEENPADQFGRQLKSFTDWLKVMKKIPAQTAVEKTEEKEAEQVRHFATHSIQERDVLTESMAEVLAKQGMLDNAIALYRKLSLIYPPKSAYFASRIEQLKASLP